VNVFGIFLTIAVYYLFKKIYEKKQKFYFNPVILSIITIIFLLRGLEIDYNFYMESAGILSFLLGPAVVSLGVPLYKKRKFVKKHFSSIGIGIVFGGLVGILSAVYIASFLGATDQVILSIGPKSVTTAIAIELADSVGGIPSLTAVLVIITGLFGNSIGLKIFNILNLKDEIIRGLAMGVTCHGLGTARIIQEDELSGAISGLAMALNGIFTSVIFYQLMKILSFV